MAERRSRKVCDREPKRWSFGDCLFDEGEWRLFVAGRQVAIESKPLEVLRVLLHQAGHVVDKDELLDRVWPDVTVVEASLPTAVRKLRLAIGDKDGDQAAIETVPGVGYRLRSPVSCEEAAGPASAAKAGKARRPEWQRKAVLAAMAGIVAVGAIAWTNQPEPGLSPNFSVAQRRQISAMRRLDLPQVERLIDAGWDVNQPYDLNGTNALEYLLNVCEWDPGHDQRRLLLVARTIMEANLDFLHRNTFGDTAYSIAKAKRYCGPDHPVTVMLRRMCVDSDGKGGDRCMATYELARGQHFPG